VTTVAPEEDVIHCPGCGGRNARGSSECDWCGRTFLSSAGRLRLTVWQLLSSLLLLGLIGAVVALALLNAGRNLPPVRVGPSASSTPAPTVVPTPAVTPRVTAANAPVQTPAAQTPLAEPTNQPLAAAPAATEEPPTPEPTATPQQAMALIANTSGQGVTVRLQPGPQAPRAGALREGTRVLLTGNDQTVAARPWREIETPDHNLKGWVLADFLQPVQSAP